MARAQDTTTDGYVTRKEYEELKDQLLAMKKELDALKKEKASGYQNERAPKARPLPSTRTLQSKRSRTVKLSATRIRRLPRTLRGQSRNR